MKTLRFLLLIFAGLLLMASCNKNNNSPQVQLIGKWVEKAPYHDGYRDTIVFMANNTIASYQPLVGWSYTLGTDSTITFTAPQGATAFSCSFLIKEKDELVIYNFVDRSTTQDVKNIEFTRTN